MQLVSDFDTISDLLKMAPGGNLPIIFNRFEKNELSINNLFKFCTIELLFQKYLYIHKV